MRPCLPPASLEGAQRYLEGAGHAPGPQDGAERWSRNGDGAFQTVASLSSSYTPPTYKQTRSRRRSKIVPGDGTWGRGSTDYMVCSELR